MNFKSALSTVGRKDIQTMDQRILENKVVKGSERILTGFERVRREDADENFGHQSRVRVRKKRTEEMACPGGTGQYFEREKGAMNSSHLDLVPCCWR